MIFLAIMKRDPNMTISKYAKDTRTKLVVSHLWEGNTMAHLSNLTHRETKCIITAASKSIKPPKGNPMFYIGSKVFHSKISSIVEGLELPRLLVFSYVSLLWWQFWLKSLIRTTRLQTEEPPKQQDTVMHTIPEVKLIPLFMLSPLLCMSMTLIATNNPKSKNREEGET